MRLGIVGLPNAGKSTLFNALTKAGAHVANYPFCTIEPNVGVVPVPDDRPAGLERMFHPTRVTPTAITFVDIAGLVRGASKGEGLGNQFLAHIREVDGIVHVVRCFSDDETVHVEGTVDPLRDIATINTELALADLDTLQKKSEALERLATKSGDKKAAVEWEFVKRTVHALSDTQTIPMAGLSGEERAWLKGYQLLRTKPVLYAANVNETHAAKPEENPWMGQVRALAAAEGVIVVCAKIEAELAELPPGQVAEYWATLGIAETGLQQLIKASYALLNLITFLTGGETEVRAWTITKGTTAREAAGKIHSDISRGFIAAEVIPYNQLIQAGSMAAAKERGWVKLQGEEYVMQDGDVTYFRFNV